MPVTAAVRLEVLRPTIGATVEMATQLRGVTTQQRVERLPVMGGKTMACRIRWQRESQHLAELEARALGPPRLATAERHGTSALFN